MKACGASVCSPAARFPYFENQPGDALEAKLRVGSSVDWLHVNFVAKVGQMMTSKGNFGG